MHPQSESFYSSTALGPAGPAYGFDRRMGSLLVKILIIC